MTLASEFRDRALGVVRAEVERLRSGLSYLDARALPEVDPQDIVVAGREVQLTIFRQAELSFLQGQVLVTVQLARFGLGGVVSFREEQGLVFAEHMTARDATDVELRDSKS